MNAAWTNRAYYTYTVQVLSRWANNTLVTNTVTDPYSLSLNANSTRSFVRQPRQPALKPAGWDDQRIPKLDAPTDIALYELHIRDFSAQDSTVPAAHRGKYLAFTDASRNPMRHLKSLQKAGMTHVHLLPSFDFASVNETGCVTPGPESRRRFDRAAGRRGSQRGQRLLQLGLRPGPLQRAGRQLRQRCQRRRGARARVPRDGAGAARSRPARDDGRGLQPHQPVAAGPLSVLDRIVPAYYYRLGADGNILNDSCCADTAQENAMMGKLMIDSVSLWAKQYKVDSFRFDIMGFTPLDLLKRLQAIRQPGRRPRHLPVWRSVELRQRRQRRALRAGAPGQHGRHRHRFVQRPHARHVRGGGCCDGGSALISQQGFINGVWYDPNAQVDADPRRCLRLADLVRVALSGTLRDYRFTDRFGNVRTNAQIDYFGQQAGFAASPAETINYIEAHDNQTLFDINAFRLPQSTLAGRPGARADAGRRHRAAVAGRARSSTPARRSCVRSRSTATATTPATGSTAGLQLRVEQLRRRPADGGPEPGQLGHDGAHPDQPADQAGHPRHPAAKAAFEDLLAIRKDTTLFRLRTRPGRDRAPEVPQRRARPGAGLVAMGIDGNDPGKYPARSTRRGRGVQRRQGRRRRSRCRR
jgi:pullulanase